jgi:hypothetical protein
MRDVEVPDGSREHQDVARGLVVPEDELPRHLRLFELDELEELEDPPPPPPPPRDEEELELLEEEPPPLDEEEEDEDEDDEAADELDDEELDEAAEELDEAVLEPEPGALVEELAVSGAARFASSQPVETSPTASVPPVSNFRNSRRSSSRGSAVSSPPGWSWSFMGSSLGSRRARGRTTHLDPSSPGIDSP